MVELGFVFCIFQSHVSIILVNLEMPRKQTLLGRILSCMVFFIIIILTEK